MLQRGITPKMSMAMGELAVKVDGHQVFSYKASGGKMPNDAELLNLIVAK